MYQLNKSDMKDGAYLQHDLVVLPIAHGQHSVCLHIEMLQQLVYSLPL